MAKRIFQAVNFTPTATADAATALANSTYMAMKGGSSTQMIDVLEIMISGLAASTSSPTIMQFARHSTIATTPTALAAPNSDGPMHPSTAALAAPAVTFVAAGTGPQRSAATSDARLNVGLNAYGGIVRWVAAPTAQWTNLGNTAQLGEASLSAFTGGTVGAVSAHIIYEPY
jgi:hypothetical protein